MVEQGNDGFYSDTPTFTFVIRNLLYYIDAFHSFSAQKKVRKVLNPEGCGTQRDGYCDYTVSYKRAHAWIYLGIYARYAEEFEFVPIPGHNDLWHIRWYDKKNELWLYWHSEGEDWVVLNDKPTTMWQIENVEKVFLRSRWNKVNKNTGIYSIRSMNTTGASFVSLSFEKWLLLKERRHPWKFQPGW